MNFMNCLFVSIMLQTETQNKYAMQTILEVQTVSVDYIYVIIIVIIITISIVVVVKTRSKTQFEHMQLIWKYEIRPKKEEEKKRKIAVNQCSAQPNRIRCIQPNERQM